MNENIPHPEKDSNIIEEIQSAKTVEDELLPNQHETFGLVQMFAACSMNSDYPPTEDNKNRNENNILRLPYWDRPENARNTLFKQYAHMSRRAGDRTRIATVHRWNLSRILSAEEIESLSYERPSRIPKGKEYHYWLRQAVIDILKTLAFDENDPTVLEQSICFYIQRHPHMTIDIESRKLAARLKSQLPEKEERQMQRHINAESQVKKKKPSPAEMKQPRWPPASGYFGGNLSHNRGTWQLTNKAMQNNLLNQWKMRSPSVHPSIIPLMETLLRTE